MKIQYIKVKFNDTFQYKYKEFHHCCDELEEHQDQFFLSGKYEDINDEYDDTEYGTYIPKMCLYKEETHSSWGDEFTDEFYYPIKCCLFCGEKYEYEVVDEVDYSDIYAVAEKKRKEYWKKYNNCDSKKGSERLRAIVRRCDDFLNEFYRIGQFKELTMGDVERLEVE